MGLNVDMFPWTPIKLRGGPAVAGQLGGGGAAPCVPGDRWGRRRVHWAKTTRSDLKEPAGSDP